MAIVRMGSNKVESIEFRGEYCPIGDYNRKDDIERGCVVVLYRTHHGLCLFERERNMRDDSDFFMTVWNPETGEAEEHMFATTRGWSYPCFASAVDATPEVRAAYDVWKAAKDRLMRVQGKLHRRKLDIELAKKMNLKNYHEVRRLKNMYDKDTFESIASLLKVKNFRSSFRESLAKQVRNWLSDENPKFRSPLSPKQLQYL